MKTNKNFKNKLKKKTRALRKTCMNICFTILYFTNEYCFFQLAGDLLSNLKDDMV